MPFRYSCATLRIVTGMQRARGASLTDKPALRRNALFATRRLTHRAADQQVHEPSDHDAELLWRANPKHHFRCRPSRTQRGRECQRCPHRAHAASRLVAHRQCSPWTTTRLKPEQLSQGLIQALKTLFVFLQCLVTRCVAFAEHSARVAAAAASTSWTSRLRLSRARRSSKHDHDHIGH